jgi:hypothetical protein
VRDLAGFPADVAGDSAGGVTSLRNGLGAVLLSAACIAGIYLTEVRFII